MNRVFDSSGPEGKVRGTPQQIIDKYNQLARDAQLSGDRVLTENYQQFAEHYLRLLGSAQKEQDQRREEQERQNRERQAERDRERAQRQERESNGGSDEGDNAGSGADMVQSDNGDDSGLVETPEDKSGEKPQKPKRSRKPRKKADDGKNDGGDQGEGGNSDASTAAE